MDSVYSFPSTSEKIGFELDLRGHSELLIAHAWLFSVASIAACSASRRKLAQLAMPGLAALGVALEVLFNVFDVVVGGIRSIRRPAPLPGVFDEAGHPCACRPEFITAKVKRLAVIHTTHCFDS